jgi:hypothetical protein
MGSLQLDVFELSDSVCARGSIVDLQFQSFCDLVDGPHSKRIDAPHRAAAMVALAARLSGADAMSVTQTMQRGRQRR